MRLYEDPWFTFRFAENRLIPRFHLDGIPAGQAIAVYKVDPKTQARLGLLAHGHVDGEGWVQLKDPLLMRAGEMFIAVPEPAEE